MTLSNTSGRRKHGASPLLCIWAAAISGVLACAGAQADRGAGGRPRRNDFALRDTAGRTVRLSDYVGKNVVLLTFWATWCSPCAAELPHLNRIYQAHKDEGLVVLGIAMDGPETVANVGPLARRYNLAFPILLDEETRVVGAYNPKRAAPFSVLIGRDAAVAKTREGYTAGDEVPMESDIVALLGAKPK